MIWLTWRQFRAAALLPLTLVTAAIIALIATGPRLGDLFRSTGDGFLDQFGADRLNETLFYAGTVAVYALPAVVGVFWGAPMVARELEAGTHRLVWNQSITRSRWLAAKLGVAAIGAALVGLLGLAMTWWSGLLDDAVRRGDSGAGLFAEPRLWPALFGARGLVPLGMVVLALVIGVALGLLLRRTVAAMGLTLVVVVAVQVVLPFLVQPHLLPAKQLTAMITNDNITEIRAIGDDRAGDIRIEALAIRTDSPGDWVTDNTTLDPSGHPVVQFPAWVTACAPPPDVPSTPESVDACFTRLADEGYRQHVSYLPASSFWVAAAGRDRRAARAGGRAGRVLLPAGASRPDLTRLTRAAAYGARPCDQPHPRHV